MNLQRRVAHWILSPAGLVLASFGLIFAYGEWREAEDEAERAVARAKQRAEEPAPKPLPPLFQAIRDKNAEAVRAAIAAGADPNAPNEKGTLPLRLVFSPPQRPMSATSRAVVEALIEGGADVNSRLGQERATALHFAARSSDLVLVQFLLARGADVNARAGDGSTPLFRTRDDNVIALLKAHGAVLEVGPDPDGQRLVDAVDGGGVKVVEQMLTAGADPNRPGRYGSTPVMTAVRSGSPKLVALLLAGGAKPDGKSQGGQSTLHVAARANNLAVGKLLIEAGADVNAARPSGWTPLHVASALCHEEFAEMLIANGAKPDARDMHGKAPLRCYAFARKPERSEPVRIASCR